LKPDFFVKTFWHRFASASLLWVVAWPVIWFFRIGDITGPKAWFWIIGELNYPVVAVAYVLIDGMLVRSGVRPLAVFLISVTTIAVCLPFYYQRFGFALGVSLEARLF
jgi:hypothetical protein